MKSMTDPGATAVMTAPASPFAIALTSFGKEAPRAMSRRTLLAFGATGIAGAVLLVGHRIGLGAALVGLAVWLPAVPALVRRRAVGDLLIAGLSIALVVMVAVRDAGWIVGLCLATAAWAGAVAVTSARSTRLSCSALSAGPAASSVRRGGPVGAQDRSSRRVGARCSSRCEVWQ